MNDNDENMKMKPLAKIKKHKNIITMSEKGIILLGVIKIYKLKATHSLAHTAVASLSVPPRGSVCSKIINLLSHDTFAVECSHKILRWTML